MRTLLAFAIASLIWIPQQNGDVIRAQGYPIWITRTHSDPPYHLTADGRGRDCIELEACKASAEQIAAEIDEFTPEKAKP